MNKKGFTLIEILAAIIILGIVGAIGVAAVSSNIVESRKNVFTNTAREVASAARGMRGQDKLPRDIKNGEALVIPCHNLTGSDLDLSGGSGFGDILPQYCYAGIVNNNGNYQYYVTMVDATNHAFIGIEGDSLSKDRLVDDETLTISGNVSSLDSTLSAFKTSYNGSTYNVQSVRIKFTTETNTYYGYYSKDGSSNSTSDINSNLEALDNFLTSSTKKITINGSNVTVKEYDVMYLILKK